MLDHLQVQKIIKLSKNFHPSLIGVFGSYARNEASRKSDLDILVEFKNKINLLELIGLEQDLSKELKMKVDLVTKRSLSPVLRSAILKELKVIHEG